PGDHGSTFGGNPLACAAALAVLDTYEESDLVAKAKRTGEQLIQSLSQLSERQMAILEVRGMGLMIGIELRKPCAPDVKAALLEAGYLVGSVGQHMIRLLPPLILDESNIPPFISALERILPEVS
ncbi:MAG: aminotransferase class III-fold pyridoxal phosphate-dependent enzyme, partial [Clostridia bacterium]|nr:aminotransferase class III-fold pyridoxal phosphate-dependent enzyme [Clostridia bacterium]